MKKIIGLLSILVFSFNVFAFSGHAQMPMMDRSQLGDDHTKQEEAEGKEVWSKLRSQQINCSDLSDENFETLGEYFMGLMMGESHAVMNVQMEQMHGKEGEEQIHLVMGKRLSGCDTSAIFQGSGSSPFDMVQGKPFWFNMMNPMMWNDFGAPSGWLGLGFGWIFMILWWVLIIAGIVALVRWIMHQGRTAGGKSAADILKERYAKGEIDKKEFEEIKKDISS